MKASISILVVLFSSFFAQAQMTNELLEEILTREVDSIEGYSGRWQMKLKELPMIVLTDETNDRMRIIAPIIEASRLDEDLLLDCMTANFHSALDVKYAISDGILWSVYIHPLSPLNEEQVKSAIEQVFLAAATFGTSFSSTPLLFGGGDQSQQNVPAKKDSLIFKKT
ncbi:hypothetical protein GCM10011344_09990 [Dokdonia pacifica]|uniref:Sensory transduction regulator n=1 Tax=Dokdonia pacifica TaxID=1627892 RepID=A0A238YMG3_9FLAO|nr:hypothetical protein [Dokdonia pacifica]GGG11308.1 hypothetical protein GCM10011344_09990 [Dokdonia pacifica]SNR72220.1 hypothetical protein SAMN06265376_102196 [Dokdonia pacifica]